MDPDSNEWIEQMLKDAKRREDIAKVLSLESEDAVGKGANYISDMYRLRARVVNGAGELETRALVFKALPGSPVTQKCIRDIGFYTRETKVYKDVLPVMKRILKKRSPGSELVWPECYGVKGRDKGYLLEDLTVFGYNVGDRLKGLDFDHASVVLESLAKFHALGAILIENGDLTETDFEGYIFCKNRKIIDTLFTNSFRELIGVMERNWKGEWVGHAKKVRTFNETFPDKVTAMFKKDPCKLKVLCHGDCWVNNLMFKYDRMGRPQHARLLDFQLSYVGSPGFDLQYFFATSLRADDTSPRKRELLEQYHAALDTYLQQFGYGGERLSLSEVLENYDHSSILGVGVMVAFRPLIMLPPSEAQDKEMLIQRLSMGSDKPLADYSYEGEDFVNAVKQGLREGMALGLF